jgi:hypothetical protein
MTMDQGASNQPGTGASTSAEPRTAAPTTSGGLPSVAEDLGMTGSPLRSGDSFGTTATDGESGDHVRDAASRIADKVGEQVDSTAGTQFGRASSMLDHIADALDKASQDLRSQEAPVADVAKMASSQLRGAADYVRDADLDSLRESAMDFARRQPALYLGGAMVLGLMASRFLKASSGSSKGSRAASSRRRFYGYGTDNDAYSYADRAYSGYGTAVGPGRPNRVESGDVTGEYGGGSLDTGNLGAGQASGSSLSKGSSTAGISGRGGGHGGFQA